MVLVPPHTEPLPDPEAVMAFRFDGSAGILLDIGTLPEFPFAAEEVVEIGVFLREETNSNLEAMENGEATGGDLEKRNVQVKLGIEFVIEEVRQER